MRSAIRAHCEHSPKMRKKRESRRSFAFTTGSRLVGQVSRLRSGRGDQLVRDVCENSVKVLVSGCIGECEHTAASLRKVNEKKRCTCDTEVSAWTWI